MLRPLVVWIVLLCAGTAAWADAAADCEKSRDWPLKIRACTAVIAADPRAGWAFINRAWAYERNGQFQNALADGNKAVELSPRQPMAYVNRAAAHIALKDYDRALADTNKALQLDGNHTDAFVNRAYLYERLGERDRAIADYRRALQIDANKQYARDALKRLGAQP